MKKRCQIDREDAVRQFRKRAEQSEESLQLHLPLKEVAAALQEGVGHLMRQAGLELMQLVMDEEVRELAGERYQRRQGEQPYRWGHEKGFLGDRVGRLEHSQAKLEGLLEGLREAITVRATGN